MRSGDSNLSVPYQIDPRISEFLPIRQEQNAAVVHDPAIRMGRFWCG